MPSLNSQTDTGAVLDTIKQSLESRDELLLGQTLADLAEIEPDRWVALLHLNNVIPDPDSKRFLETYALLAGGLSHALRNSSFPTNSYFQIMLPCLNLAALFSSIRQRLDELSVWERPAIRLILRLAAFVEDQSYLINNEITTGADGRGYHDPREMFSANLATLIDGPKTSRLAMYEGHCEILQLVLSYSMHKFHSDFFGDIGVNKSPYGDADFTHTPSLGTNMGIA